MNSFAVEIRPELPALAFAAEIRPGVTEIRVLCGSAVETDQAGVIAGAWAGPFEGRAFERGTTSTGTALQLTDQGLCAAVGTASPTALFFCRRDSRLVVSNSLALSLAVAGDRLVTSYPYYPLDLCSYVYGRRDYRHTVPTASGQLSVYYGSMLIGADLGLTPLPAPPPPAFADFAAYRTYLVEQTRAVLANAADPARHDMYRPIVALSAGYDSPAAAVIGRDAGCREGFTFDQAVNRRDNDDDSGAEIGRRLGLATMTYQTYAYRERTDLPEIEFIASNFGGGQVYLSTTGTALRHRIVLSGYGGDHVWSKEYGFNPRRRYPFYIGGYSQTEFFLRAPALDLAVPVIGVRSVADIGAISRSAAMAPWSVDGDYDRPIARRLIEEAGVPRGSFATAKRRVTPDYENLMRRSLDLDRFLSPASRAAFEAWFAAEQPIDRWQELRHRLVSDSLGRILWSGKLSRALERHGIDWPPRPGRLLRLRVPIRKNAFVFNWAVARQVDAYRALLARAADQSAKSLEAST